MLDISVYILRWALGLFFSEVAYASSTWYHLKSNVRYNWVLSLEPVFVCSMGARQEAISLAVGLFMAPFLILSRGYHFVFTSDLHLTT